MDNTIPYIVMGFIVGLPVIVGIASLIKFFIGEHNVNLFRGQYTKQLANLNTILTVLKEEMNKEGNVMLYFRESRKFKQMVLDIPLDSQIDNSKEALEDRYNQREELINSFIKKNHKYLKSHFREQRLKELLKN